MKREKRKEREREREKRDVIVETHLSAQLQWFFIVSFYG